MPCVGTGKPERRPGTPEDVKRWVLGCLKSAVDAMQETGKPADWVAPHVEVAAKILETGTLQPVLDKLTDDPEVEVAEEKVVAELGEAVAEPLKAMLRSPNEGPRYYACGILSEMAKTNPDAAKKCAPALERSIYSWPWKEVELYHEYPEWAVKVLHQIGREAVVAHLDTCEGGEA